MNHLVIVVHAAPDRGHSVLLELAHDLVAVLVQLRPPQNPLTFLAAYLTACAENQGRAPQDLRRFCPWSMTALERQTLTRPPEAEPG